MDTEALLNRAIDEIGVVTAGDADEIIDTLADEGFVLEIRAMTEDEKRARFTART